MTTSFKEYKPSRKLMLVYLFVAVLFVSIGIFVLLLPSIIASGNVQFSGDVRFLWWSGAGLVVTGVLLGSLAYWLVGAKPSVRLYDEAISVGCGKQWRTDRFVDIEDLYFFPYMGKIAYRTGEASSWVYINYNLNNFYELREEVRQRHIQQRGSMLYEKILQGDKVVFRHFTKATGYKKSAVTTDNLDMPVKDMVLTHSDLTIDGNIFPIRNLAGLQGDDWSETLTLRDTQGNVLFSTHAASVLSVDLLHMLIVVLQEHAPANDPITA